MTKQIKLVNQPLNAEGLLKLDLQTFAEPPALEETPPGGGEPPVTPTPPVEPTTPPVPPKSFSQDDVNAIATKQAREAQEKMLKQLGIEDFDNAKEGMKKFQEWQESQKTEVEKQAEALKNFETKNGTLSNENETLKASLSALKAGVLSDSVPDVVTLAKTMVTDDVDMDAAIAAVVEKYPHFAQAAQKETGDSKPKFSNGQHQTQPSSDADKWLAAFKQ